MAYELIETVEVGAGGASSIEFTSIPQDGVDLVLLNSSRVDNDNVTGTIQFNNDTGSNYDMIRLTGDGSSASSFTNTSIFLNPNRDSFTANTFSNGSTYVSNYTSSANKSVSIDTVTENNASSVVMGIFAGSYSTTSAITSLKVTAASGGLFVENSTFSLYKIS